MKFAYFLENNVTDDHHEIDESMKILRFDYIFYIIEGIVETRSVANSI